jgi:hypothetical protein
VSTGAAGEPSAASEREELRGGQPAPDAPVGAGDAVLPGAALAESEAPRDPDTAPASVAEARAPAEAANPANVAQGSGVPVDERLDALADASIPERRAPTPSLADVSSGLSERVGVPVAPSVSPEPVVTTGARAAADVSGASRRTEQGAQLERAFVSEQRSAPGALGDLRLAAPRGQTSLARPLERQSAGVASVRPPLTLPGLDVEIVEEGDVGPDAAIRVGQRTREGTPVELYFVGVKSEGVDAAKAAAGVTAGAAPPPGAAVGSGPVPAAPPPAASPAPPEHVATFRVPIGWEQLIVPFGGGWLIAQAPLSRGALRGLLESAGVPLP